MEDDKDSEKTQSRLEKLSVENELDELYGYLEPR